MDQKATIDTPEILTLDAIDGQAVGGKASGLAELKAMGLAVPEAFVIRNAKADDFPVDLDAYYQRIGGGNVAVRSSAIGEDGEQASFAGQYETVLNVNGTGALREAIAHCVASLHTERAKSYQEDADRDLETSMCVVVQVMVDAQTAGVLFSADPVSGRHDRLVIDAVTGLGEALVSGETTPDHYEFDLENKEVARELAGDGPILDKDALQALVEDARRAVIIHGDHLDMEWAIDHTGTVYWLQARPITTLGCDLNAGYTPIPANHVVTRCNVGEMMPGPVCPLTFSTQGRAIEHGMQHMHVCYAGREAITDEWTQINLFYGHMFINLTGGISAARAVSLTTPESIGMSLCGREVPELQEPKNKKPLPLRWLGNFRFFNYCLKASKYIAEFESRFRHFHIRYTDDSLSMVEEMEAKFPWLCETNEVHLRSSAYSGVMSGIIQGVAAGKSKNADSQTLAEQQAESARLLAGATDVESAVMVEHLDELVDLIAESEATAQTFRAASTAEALSWLQDGESGAIGIRFADFLKHHGHRGYRELCVREKSWRDDPERVVQTMQASVLARLSGNYQAKAAAEVDMSGLSRALKFLLPKAHLAIRQREQTKSMLVDATYRLKCGYRHLGELLALEGKLDDADLVFFMSREELSGFCRKPDANMAALCAKRRTALEFQEKLEFEDIHVGFASPSEREIIHSGNENEYIGRPVSRGVVEGVARVALTLEEAAELQPGEILISHITDIGWTPYFSLIAGLATDVGSAVSHGAVIAREYGLPAIVNLRVATKLIKTGDLVRLDADKGVLTKLE